MNGSKIDRECYIIRQVASVKELHEVFVILGAQFAPPIPRTDRVFADLVNHYPQDRRLMLVAEKDGQIVGGVLGFENILRIIALVPAERGKGLGRRLIQTFEIGAMQRGIRTISLGAKEGAKGFYVRMGYRGKTSMHKDLPLPGRVLDFRLKKLKAMIGDLEAGQVVQTDETGKVPPLL